MSGVETVFGPCVARTCVGCGQVTYGTPEYPDPRCEECSIEHYGVLGPAWRMELRAPRGTLGPVGVGGIRLAITARGEVGGLAPHPAPESACRLAGTGDMGRRALALQRAAQGAGWHVQATHARGWGVHGMTGKPTSVCDSVAVRCWGPSGRRIVMSWLRGKSAWTPSVGIRWSPSHPLELITCDVAIEWIRDTVATGDREHIDGRDDAP